jgi:hypothetical protein
MSNIITFPAARHPVPTRPTRIADLPAGTEAIVIVRARGGFALTMRQPERKVRTWYPERKQALRQARAIATSRPSLYRLILDQTGTGGTA